MNAKRLTTVVLALAAGVALLSPLSNPSATAADLPRLPRDAADWETFTPDERKAALDYEWQRFQAALAAGTARIEAILGTAGAGDSTSVSATSAWAQCGFQVSNAGLSRYVRGGGTTTASTLMDYIYASKSTRQGQFIRDGVLKGNWYRSLTDASYVEAWTGWDHSWQWEHPRYTSNGWHGALKDSTWYLGPDAPCPYSWTP